jgi:tRNA threonylcarbamoyladenosine biosynthesis protein TsaE
MPHLRVATSSAAETRLLGRRLGERALAGDVICLIGDLGAGKTQIAQGIAEGLGIPAESVTSPTYALIAEHYSGRVPLYHMDAYRLADASELGPIGFDDYLSRFDGALVIEWADKIASALPDDRLNIELSVGELENLREIILNPSGERATVLAAGIP